jgi:hypothetical protein
VKPIHNIELLTLYFFEKIYLSSVSRIRRMKTVICTAGPYPENTTPFVKFVQNSPNVFACSETDKPLNRLKIVMYLGKASIGLIMSAGDAAIRKPRKALHPILTIMISFLISNLS